MEGTIGTLSRNTALLALLAGSAIGQERSVEIVVTSDLDAPRGGETVEVDASLLRAALGEDLQSRVRAVDEGSGREILAQAIDLDGDGRTDQVVFQADFGPRESRSFRILAEERRPYRREDFRVYGRFVRERLDDFAWENDRIAHRMYGAALETWAAEPLTSSAVDVWTKRTRRLVIDDWYRVDDYHQDSGEGADLYSAGSSRGCGGSGLWRGGRLVVSRNFRASRVLASGPIRLVFELDYPAWDDPAVRSETKRITLDAGSNLDRFESRYDVTGGGPLTWAVGIEKEAGDDVRVDREAGVLRTWAPLHGDQGHLGCGVIVPPSASLVDVTEGERDHLVLARSTGNGPAAYYAGFGWDRSGDFASARDWDAYLDSFAKRVGSPLRIRVATP
jgi:unsaturated rhamnogalacturonyl hydrolase